jgi:heme-degrading monooxygenase HmoA
VIRLVGLLGFREGTTEAEIEAFQDAVMALEVEGMVSLSANRTLKLRARDADFVVVAEFEDEEAFRRFDTDEAHGELRAGIGARIIENGFACLQTV